MNDLFGESSLLSSFNEVSQGHSTLIKLQVQVPCLEHEGRELDVARECVSIALGLPDRAIELEIWAELKNSRVEAWVFIPAEYSCPMGVTALLGLSLDKVFD